MDDGELARLAQAGRAEAFVELTKRWSGKVLAVCYARVGRQAAEDLAQESLLRAWKGVAALDDPHKFGSWLCGIAVRVCLDWLKAKARTEVPFGSLAADGRIDWPARAADGADERERLEDLRAAVARLPAECREVLALYYGTGGTYEHIARALGVSAATVNARLTRARKLLRSRLAAECEDGR